MHIFMYVPAAGHISAAIYRSRFGSLTTRAAGPGVRVSRVVPPLPAVLLTAIWASAILF